jgi:hypothetical protein
MRPKAPLYCIVLHCIVFLYFCIYCTRPGQLVAARELGGGRASGPKDIGSSCTRHQYKSPGPSIKKIYLLQLHDSKRPILIEHKYRCLQVTEFSDATQYRHQHSSPAATPAPSRQPYPLELLPYPLYLVQGSTNNCLHIPHGLAGGLISVATATALNLICPCVTAAPNATLSAHVPTGYDAFSTFAPSIY